MFKNIGGNVSIEVIIGAVGFLLFVATAFTYLNKENTEAKAFADAHKALLSQVESINKKLDDMTLISEQLTREIEAAHNQADSAKSRAEAADHLAHKVAIDLAKRPAHAVQTSLGPIKMEPVKFEPIKVVIYDKRDLKKSTEMVKAPVKDAAKTLKQ